MPSGSWRRNKPALPTHPSGQSCTRSSCSALLLAQHFIRQARTRCDAHLKVLIRYHLTMAAIFMYLCHLICLGVISSFCSVICFPPSCPLRVCYSVILPLPFHFGSLCMVWDESGAVWSHLQSVWAVMGCEAPNPVRGVRAAVRTAMLLIHTSLFLFVCPVLPPSLNISCNFASQQVQFWSFASPLQRKPAIC